MADARSPRALSSDAIDRVVHDPTRFRILACLFVVEAADFLFLMRQLQLTKGNLSSHMTRLEAAGYVTVNKGEENNRSKTLLRLTAAGRGAVEHYAGHMQLLLDGLHRDPARRETRGRTRASNLKPRLA